MLKFVRQDLISPAGKVWLSGVSLAALIAVSVTALSSPANAETLNEALTAAYQTNPKLDAERAKLRATDEEVSRAESGFRPTTDDD